MNLGFKSLHPVTNLIFFLFTFILSLTSTNPFLILLCFIGAIIYDVKLQKGTALNYILRFVIPLIVFITVFNSIFSHYGVTVLFVMKNGNNFTLEAIIYGLVTGVKMGSMLLWLDCCNEIITSEKIIYLFGNISPKLALVISMVLRFIPLIRAQSQEIVKAEKGIGVDVTSKNFFKKIATASRRLSILVSWTLERGIDTTDSMKARGYGLKGRTSYGNYVFMHIDGIISLLCLMATAVLFACKNKLETYYNPVIIIPKSDTVAIVSIIFFAVVLMTPIVFDLTEEKKWLILK